MVCHKGQHSPEKVIIELPGEKIPIARACSQYKVVLSNDATVSVERKMDRSACPL